MIFNITGPGEGKSYANNVLNYQFNTCGFVWNTNTMIGFVSDAWADRCVIIESEYPDHMTRTRSTKQIQDTVANEKMNTIAAMCLYRQNLIQSANNDCRI